LYLQGVNRKTEEHRHRRVFSKAYCVIRYRTPVNNDRRFLVHLYVLINCALSFVQYLIKWYVIINSLCLCHYYWPLLFHLDIPNPYILWLLPEDSSDSLSGHPDTLTEHLSHMSYINKMTNKQKVTHKSGSCTISGDTKNNMNFN